MAWRMDFRSEIIRLYIWFHFIGNLKRRGKVTEKRQRLLSCITGVGGGLKLMWLKKGKALSNYFI